MSDTPNAIQELKDELDLLAERIKEAQETLQIIEDATEAISQEGEYIPSLEQAQRQMSLVVEDLDLEYLHTHAYEVSSLFQDLYESVREDRAIARGTDIRVTVMSLVTEKTGEVGLAEKIADEVEEMNEDLEW